MNEHVSSERMGEALDGLLTASEVEVMDRHLLSCAPCRNEYARLYEVVTAVRSLPRSAAVDDGLWAGIESRVSGDPVPVQEVRVYALPTGAAPARRVSLSVAQLAAAAALVALLSAAVVWLALEGARLPDGIMARAEAPVPGTLAARAVSSETDRYSSLMRDLEAVLAGGRGVLAPETLASIEASLATIDQAIDEVETALATDPGSDLLRRMLAGHQKTRLGVLRRAASAVQAAT